MMRMDESIETNLRERRDKANQSFANQVHMFTAKEGSGEIAGTIKVAAIICYPAWFILPAHSTEAGFGSVSVIIVIFGILSAISSVMVVRFASRKEYSILETIHRLLGTTSRRIYLFMGMVQYLIIGGMFFSIVS